MSLVLGLRHEPPLWLRTDGQDPAVATLGGDIVLINGLPRSADRDLPQDV
jgi:hypothetical protein